jgi:large subunit ribosomal protein L23
VNEAESYSIIRAPHISEKSTIIGANRQYVFKIDREANKAKVKKAVEKLFNVKVKSVQICNVKSKPARTGRVQGRHKAWKKAYVSLDQGHTIELANDAA